MMVNNISEELKNKIILEYESQKYGDYTVKDYVNCSKAIKSKVINEYLRTMYGE